MKRKFFNLMMLTVGLLSVVGLRPVQADFDSWYEKARFFGDFRFRHENIEADKTNERDRQRVRVRLNMEATPDDYWKTKLRFSTGASDPVSTNQTLGGDGSNYMNRNTVGLDVACVEYKALFENLTLIAGKMDTPFVKVGKNQLIWDGDLTMEGIAGNAKMDICDEVNLFSNGGGFWLLEQSANYDPMLYAGQFGFTGKLMDVKYTLGGSYYMYKDSKGQKTFVNTSSGAGNSTRVDASGNTTYSYNYKIAEAFLEMTGNLPMINMPLTVYANAVKNADDSVAERNTGYTAGFVLNKAKKALDWELGYYARKLDKDAVVGAYSDSDFLGGGTDGLGHVFTGTFMASDNVSLQVTHFNCQKKADLDASRIGYHRTQIDLNLKY